MAIGLLTTISVAPKSEAMTANVRPSLQQPAAHLHSQIIFKIGEQGDPRREEAKYYRDLEIQREIERCQY